VTDVTGQMLGGRYRLGEQIGAGGMARVYRAEDTRLDRTVAVKILSAQFADDPSFVDRFRREARTAAKLNHPNVVGVYDNGAEDGTNYIVMEYVEGRTLAEFLSGGGRLSPTKSVEVAEAVCTALEYAHERGVVHRDIKPGNIMVTHDGLVKVMDFGIARLTTTAETVAQTAAVLGTAAYLSPEQAQGQSVDGRSDIYSLGCVLFELLTGSAPFSGDSAMAVAMKHIHDAPPVASKVNPEITPQMDAVVMKALAKNRDNRYQTASEFREDLERLRRGELVSATPIMATPTQVIDRRPSHPGEATAVLPPGEEEGRKWWVAALIISGILAILAGGAYVLANALLSDSGRRVVVPSVVGRTLEEAQAALADQGLRVAPDVPTERQAGAEPGTVIAQDPRAGESVPRDTEVTLTVASRGSGTREVPDVEGTAADEAEAILEDKPYNFAVTRRDRSDDAIAEGFAIGTDPQAGEQLQPGSPITLLVSSGPPTTTTSPPPATALVPDVVCRSLNSAQNQITNAGLTSSVVGSQPNPSCPNTNKVAAQAPGGGTEVEQGTTVKLWTSEPGSSGSPSA
jgi:eukaryotic-like serine/threonine-protein kinase